MLILRMRRERPVLFVRGNSIIVVPFVLITAICFQINYSLKPDKTIGLKIPLNALYMALLIGVLNIKEYIEYLVSGEFTLFWAELWERFQGFFILIPTLLMIHYLCRFSLKIKKEKTSR
ncbi:MAG: hypothetical protein ACRCST_16265 [Turicibacter sp.]